MTDGIDGIEIWHYIPHRIKNRIFRAAAAAMVAVAEGKTWARRAILLRLLDWTGLDL
jgi:hypothetical protein